MTATEIVASALGISVDRVTDDLEYQGITEWDSLGHVKLLVAMEHELNIPISDDLAVKLSSVKAIQEVLTQHASGNISPHAHDTTSIETGGVHRGLEGVIFDRSSITDIDVDQSRILYRGYDVRDLVGKCTFEKVAWLLMCGDLPSPTDLSAFQTQLRASRALPASIIALIRSVSVAHPIFVLRTAISALGSLKSEPSEKTHDEARRAGIRLLAQIPTVIATHHAIRLGREPPEPDASLDHAENFATMLLGTTTGPLADRFFAIALILHADHSSNASTFAARIAMSTGGDMHGAITSAIATFAGPLHGGAAEGVLHFIDQAESPDAVAAQVEETIARGGRVMGFGHRVYRGEDPRVSVLREAAMVLSDRRGDWHDFEKVEAMKVAMKPYSRYGLAANVDLYSGLTYRLLGLQSDLSGPMFAAGRAAGWVAHALEQLANNVLIRPLLRYVGVSLRQVPK